MSGYRTPNHKSAWAGDMPELGCLTMRTDPNVEMRLATSERGERLVLISHHDTSLFCDANHCVNIYVALNVEGWDKRDLPRVEGWGVEDFENIRDLYPSPPLSPSPIEAVEAFIERALRLGGTRMDGLPAVRAALEAFYMSAEAEEGVSPPPRRI